MDNRRFAWIAGGGCLLLVLLLGGLVALLIAAPIAFFDGQIRDMFNPGASPVSREASASTNIAVQDPIPTLTLPPSSESGAQDAGLQGTSLEALYEQVNAGVVSIQVVTTSQGLTGAGAGSGFIIDEQGHIVTNYHVVQNADEVTVIFFDGTQAIAEVVGQDPDSDLAVVRVDGLPENTHPLPLGDSDAVRPGQWVVAIGNPFGLASSMTAGIVSATGRTIPAVEVPYNIPQAIQTDAAINPGNSGGPLLNLRGEVIGVPAQIRPGSGIAANAGVGFAIPSNIVRRVIPVLVVEGEFQWPWLGISGGSVSLAIAEQNNLETQQGAYIVEVIAGGPAADAGLRGAREIVSVNGIAVPVGGDVIVEVAGEPIETFDELLTIVANHDPGDVLPLTVLRDGERLSVEVQLEPRPENLGTEEQTFP
ncbi:MAG: PDZ domain-containing protein [Chloroflexi bacterium]|nr:PDZ domain-containing protein [Chloroflexota bacterium]